MADQLAASALAAYGHKLVKTPNLDRLAAQGTVFENAYSPNPRCASSRFAMMSGQRSSRIGAFDNASEFPAAVPSFAHYLRSLGYSTCLSGKMHFVGPDQLHGFEERVTTDIYPCDFRWSANWAQNIEPYAPSPMSMRGVVESGRACARCRWTTTTTPPTSRCSGSTTMRGALQLKMAPTRFCWSARRRRDPGQPEEAPLHFGSSGTIGALPKLGVPAACRRIEALHTRLGRCGPERRQGPRTTTLRRARPARPLRVVTP